MRNPSALEVDEKHFGTPCHHKFKMSFSGCPIDCARTSEMDLGFQGVVYPVWSKDLCNGCTLCAKACQEGAIVSDKEGRPMFDESKCVYCGDCIRACPTDAWKDKKKGWMVRTGGKHGRHPRVADLVANFLPDSKVNDFISATLKWYKENGKTKERIGTVIDRVGLDKFKRSCKCIQITKEWNNCINIKNHDDEGQKKFVIFAHSGTYDKLYQTITLAITAAAMGRETYIFLFSGR